MKRRRIAFVSNMEGMSWGGSEELWSRTALRLKSEGLEVSSSVQTWLPPHPRILELRNAGIDVYFRARNPPLMLRAWRLVATRKKSGGVAELEKLILQKPDLIVFSSGSAFPDVDVLEACVSLSVPFVTLGHANFEVWWPTDELAERYRLVLPKALACYFVSKGNQRLAFKQIGCELPASEVVWNPVNIDGNSIPPFPQYTESEGLLMACVGRLHPPSKGQDILLDALATPVWSRRSWRLRLYGNGPMKTGIECMVQRLGLHERVALMGYRPVDEIWRENQVLVLPSRYEGLPISIVEAMMCGRPTVATAVAGNMEVIDDGVTGFLAEAPMASAMLGALERLWERRSEVQRIGLAAAKRIREVVPADPVGDFARNLTSLMNLASASSTSRD